MKKIFIIVVLFFYVLAPRINSYINIHTGIFALITIISIERKRITESFRIRENTFFILFIFLLIIYHSLLALIYGNELNHFNSILISDIFYIIFSYLFARYVYDDRNDVNTIFNILKYVVFIVVFNSIIIIIEFLITDVKLIIESFLNTSSANIDYLEHPFRLRGLAAAGGAGLSIVNAACVWFCVVLVREKQINHTLGLIFIIVIDASNIFTGRSGLIYGIIFTLYFLLFEYIPNRVGSIKELTKDIIIVLILFQLLPEINISNEILSWAFEWTNVFQSGEFSTNSTDDLEQMLFIPNDIGHILFGIGFFEGKNELYPRTDSGYLKSMFSVGLILSIVLYYFLISRILRLIRLDSNLKVVFYPILVLLVISEIKEPFMYQNYLARIIFLLVGAGIFIRIDRLKLNRKVGFTSNLSK
jgi:hypothetical protein